MRKLGAGVLAIALVFAVAACGDDSGGSSSDTGGGDGGNFGDCDVTVAKGELGDVELTNDGELTVVTSLPAPGFWNGDDPDSINGGFEYCMAADMATSLGLDKVKVVERLLRRAGGRPDQPTSTSPSRRSRSPTSGRRSSTSRRRTSARIRACWSTRARRCRPSTRPRRRSGACRRARPDRPIWPMWSSPTARPQCSRTLRRCSRR